MIRMIMHGCGGAMGHTITGLAKDMKEIEIVAGVDLKEEDSLGYPVFSSLEACNVEADVIVDFASAKAVDHLLDYCGEKKMPLVLCTTGLSEEQLRKVKETSEKTAILRSANMSLGINTLLKLLQDAAKVLAEQVLIWKLWKSITIRRWMHPAEQLWLWQIPSMRQWMVSTTMFMTEARNGRREMKKKSEFLQYAGALL